MYAPTQISLATIAIAVATPTIDANILDEIISITDMSKTDLLIVSGEMELAKRAAITDMTADHDLAASLRAADFYDINTFTNL